MSEQMRVTLFQSQNLASGFSRTPPCSGFHSNQSPKSCRIEYCNSDRFCPMSQHWEEIHRQEKRERSRDRKRERGGGQIKIEIRWTKESERKSNTREDRCHPLKRLHAFAWQLIVKEGLHRYLPSLSGVGGLSMRQWMYECLCLYVYPLFYWPINKPVS